MEIKHIGIWGSCGRRSSYGIRDAHAHLHLSLRFISFEVAAAGHNHTAYLCSTSVDLQVTDKKRTGNTLHPSALLGSTGGLDPLLIVQTNHTLMAIKQSEYRASKRYANSKRVCRKNKTLPFHAVYPCHFPLRGTH